MAPVNGLYLNGMTGAYTLPLGNNYWDGGTPSVIRNGTDIAVQVDFDPTLGSPPAQCGPSW